MKKNDIIMIVVILLIALASYFGYRFLYQETGTLVVITVDNKELSRHLLSKDTSIEISGIYGMNYIEIKDGYVKMNRAPCKDQICVNHKSIHYNGETIVCLPNKIMIKIIGGDTWKLDTIAE